MSTAPPKRQPIPFGKYLLLDRINIGGMAEVWRAKTFGAGGFERLVAIKRILPNIAEDEEFITMFIDEAKITVQLNHANIAQIYELANISNSYFIAMEYISGKDMRAVFDRCRKRGEPAPIPLTCYLIARCCEGLDYAHRNKDRMGRDMNIVHRDVSPQNALISYDGEVKVIDFGIAKAAGKATKTQAGILKGKFGYMSPEQIRGLPLDRRSDVFAIGICLYEMLTGERLFVGDSDFSVLEKVRKVEVLPPSHFNRRIPDALEKIVMKALAKDVEDRYQYASELGDDLQRFLVTSENVFGRKDLAAFMKATFAEEVEKEKQRLQEYVDVRPPDGMLASNMGGYGPAPVPVLAAPVAQSPSAVTAIPTLVPPGQGSVPTAQVPTSQMETAMGLPMIARPMPPTGPAAGPGAMPKLTAAPPASANGKDEHAATLVVDPNKPFDPEQTNPGDEKSPDVTTAAPIKKNEVPTDPQRGAVNRDGQPNASIDDAFAPTRASPSGLRPNPAGPPVLLPQTEMQRRPPGMREGVHLAPVPPAPPDPSDVGLPVIHTDDSNPPVPLPAPYTPRMAPAERATRGAGGSERPRRNRAPPPPSGGNGLVIAAVVAAILALVVGGLVLSGKLRPAQGLLMLDVPTELYGKVRVNVNGKPMNEPDGKGGSRLITEWPQLLKVPAGKVTVLMTAPGYKPLTETIEIAEGNDINRLKNTLTPIEAAPEAPPEQ